MKEFWIRNWTNRNICLSDLNLTIYAKTSVNLLDKKHYHYTEEQLITSEVSGSLFAKNKFLFHLKIAPIKRKIHMDMVSATIPDRKRSMFEIKEQNFDELEIHNIAITGRTEEEINKAKYSAELAFAEDNAELAEMDRMPLLTEIDEKKAK